MRISALLGVLVVGALASRAEAKATAVNAEYVAMLRGIAGQAAVHEWARGGLKIAAPIAKDSPVTFSPSVSPPFSEFPAHHGKGPNVVRFYAFAQAPAPGGGDKVLMTEPWAVITFTFKIGDQELSDPVIDEMKKVVEATEVAKPAAAPFPDAAFAQLATAVATGAKIDKPAFGDLRAFYRQWLEAYPPVAKLIGAREAKLIAWTKG